jgi:hypothetical protein
MTFAIARLPALRPTSGRDGEAADRSLGKRQQTLVIWLREAGPRNAFADEAATGTTSDGDYTPVPVR